MSTGGVVGFDFGTQSAVISQAKRGGIDTVLNEASKRKTASMVSFSGKQRFLGEQAVPLARSNFRNTVTNFKRLLGKSFSQPEVQEDIKRMPDPSKFVQLDGDRIGVKVEYNDETKIFTPEEVTAMLFTQLRKTVAMANSGMAATDIVISVPGYWDERQRRSLLDACQIAGFHPLRIINDHTAAALSYGIYKSARNVFDKEQKEYVMFVDVGYANTSVAVVSFVQGKLQVVSSAYDRRLGGRDFDYEIMNRLADEFKQKYKLEPRDNVKSVLKLIDAAEKAKQTLTPEGVTLAKINIEFLVDEIDFRTELTLDDMESMCAPLLDRLKATVVKALADSKISVEQLHAIEIIGGGTRPRCVKRAIATCLGLDQSKTNYGLSATLNADESVARGCALNSAMLSPQFRVKEFDLGDCVIYPIRLTWDEKEQAQAESMDVEQGDEDADMKDTVGTNSILIMQEFDETPKVRRVTFRRQEDFEITASYDGSALNVLPAGTEPLVGKYRVEVSKKEKFGNDIPRIRVNFRHNMSGIFEVLSAQCLQEIESKSTENSTGQKEQGGSEMNTVENTEGELKGEESKQAPEASTDAAKSKKKQYRRIELTVNSAHLYGMSAAEISAAAQSEHKYTEQDRMIEETGAAKNELEAYIYGMRTRIDDVLRDYLSESEKSSFRNALDREESWLYDEGFDDVKAEYQRRLRVLKEDGDRFETRYFETQERPRAARSLTTSINDYLAVVNSPDEMYSHITDEERDRVRKSCQDAAQWLDVQSSGQEKLTSTSDPVLTSRMINEELSKLQAVAQPIVTKRKPPPPKPSKDENEAKKEEFPKENKDEEGDEKMGDAEGKEKRGEGEEKMETSSLD